MRIRHALCGALFLATTLSAPRAADPKLEGEVAVAGSSTVGPITKLVAEAFEEAHPDVKLNVAITGTSNGFKQFCHGRCDVNAATRPIKADEIELCAKNKVEIIEVQVAWRALAVVVPRHNRWVRRLTLPQLKKIWLPDADDFKSARTWNEVDPQWPEENVVPFGPPGNARDFDFMTGAINGKPGHCRGDYQPMDDEGNLPAGFELEKHSLGIMRPAHAERHKDKFRTVAISLVPDDGPDEDEEDRFPGKPSIALKRHHFAAPTLNAIRGGTYPLRRSLLIYVNKASLEKPQVRAFAAFYLDRPDLAAKADYVALGAGQIRTERAKLGAQK